eukprot:tig00000144_g9005.t1
MGRPLSESSASSILSSSSWGRAPRSGSLNATEVGRRPARIALKSDKKLLSLPEDLLALILSFCGATSLCALSSTCSTLRRLAEASALWRSRFQKDFGAELFAAAHEGIGEAGDWRRAYRERHEREGRELLERVRGRCQKSFRSLGPHAPLPRGQSFVRYEDPKKVARERRSALRMLRFALIIDGRHRFPLTTRYFANAVVARLEVLQEGQAPNGPAAALGGLPALLRRRDSSLAIAGWVLGEAECQLFACRSDRSSWITLASDAVARAERAAGRGVGELLATSWSEGGAPFGLLYSAHVEDLVARVLCPLSPLAEADHRTRMVRQFAMAGRRLAAVVTVRDADTVAWSKSFTNLAGAEAEGGALRYALVSTASFDTSAFKAPPRWAWSSGGFSGAWEGFLWVDLTVTVDQAEREGPEAVFFISVPLVARPLEPEAAGHRRPAASFAVGSGVELEILEHEAPGGGFFLAYSAAREAVPALNSEEREALLAEQRRAGFMRGAAPVAPPQGRTRRSAATLAAQACEIREVAITIRPR